MALLALLLPVAAPHGAGAATYYVRQTVGDDAQDGLSAATAWQHVTRLGGVMQAGDTAYVGPGLYREQIDVQYDGTSQSRITFVADTTGQHTGDPPGVVLLAGSEPVDEAVFTPRPAPAVYGAKIPYQVWGVVEMDGPQSRHVRASLTAEHLVQHVPEADVVAHLPSSFTVDERTGDLLVHTSDGAPPPSHELELIQRGNGFFMVGRYFITIVGFTFRHMQDAGISFFKDSGDGIAVGNTAYGSRQGIRVYAATNVLLQGNTLFRNENSGAYFAASSTSGVAIGNVAYENLKGLRWSSQSNNALALDNWCFENSERGLSLENVDGALLRRNLLAGNAVSQLLILQSPYGSESNCFESDRAEQLTADFRPFPPKASYPMLADYQLAQHQDLHSSAGGCGPRPPKVDVGRLHAETLAYAERARRILHDEAPPAVPPSTRSWLDWLLGR